MPWVYLAIAGVLEIGWATGLKYTEGFTRLWPTTITVVLMIGSYVALAQSMNPKISTIPVLVQRELEYWPVAVSEW